MTAVAPEIETLDDAITVVADWMRTQYSCPADQARWGVVADWLDHAKGCSAADRELVVRVLRLYLGERPAEVPA